MYFLTTRAAFRPQTLRQGYTALSSFHTTPIRALKESDHDRPGRDEHYESEKHDQLHSARKEGQGKYKSQLASNSEESVKADRGEFDGKNIKNEKELKEMQEKSKRDLNEGR